MIDDRFQDISLKLSEGRKIKKFLDGESVKPDLKKALAPICFLLLVGFLLGFGMHKINFDAAENEKAAIRAIQDKAASLEMKRLWNNVNSLRNDSREDKRWIGELTLRVWHLEHKK